MQNKTNDLPRKPPQGARKPYRKPRLISDRVFSADALGGCRTASFPDGCGRDRAYYLSST